MLLHTSATQHPTVSCQPQSLGSYNKLTYTKQNQSSHLIDPGLSVHLIFLVELSCHIEKRKRASQYGNLIQSPIDSWWTFKPIKPQQSVRFQVKSSCQKPRAPKLGLQVKVHFSGYKGVYFVTYICMVSLRTSVGPVLFIGNQTSLHAIVLFCVLTKVSWNVNHLADVFK